MSKDIFYSGMIYQGSERDIPTGHALDWKMEQWHTYLTKLPNYPVHNPPSDWIDGKDVSGLYAISYEIFFNTDYIPVGEPAYLIHQGSKRVYAIPLSVSFNTASSGEKEENCQHEGLTDTGVGYYHCPMCDKGWTYKEWEVKQGKVGIEKYIDVLKENYEASKKDIDPVRRKILMETYEDLISIWEHQYSGRIVHIPFEMPVCQDCGSTQGVQKRFGGAVQCQECYKDEKFFEDNFQ